MITLDNCSFMRNKSSKTYGKLFPSISKYQAIKFDKPDYNYKFNDFPKIVNYQDNYYLLFHGLYTYNELTSAWRMMDQSTYFPGKGVSLTATPEGLVLYGGKTRSMFLKDMSIYSNSWRSVAGNQTCRAYHAACWIPEKNSLFVHGGKNKQGVLSDAALIDLVNGAVTEIKLSQELPLSHHTVTLMNYPQVLIAGGVDANKHLNHNLYSVDLSTGEVRLLTSSTVSARCAHHAFNFYGFLCITSGFKNGKSLCNLGFYDPIHNVWLKLPLSKRVKVENPWFVIFEGNRIKLFDLHFRSTISLYFNQNYEPFVNSNDQNLLNFFSNLLDINIARLSYQVKEEKYSRVLITLDELRKRLADNFTKQKTNSSAIKISSLISEKDQLRQAIIRLENESKHQEKIIKIKEQNIEHPKPKSEEKPIDVLRNLIHQIAAYKKQTKDEISARRAKIIENMARFESLGVSPQASNYLAFDKSEGELILNSTNTQQIDQELKDADAQILSLQQKMNECRVRKLSINWSFAEGITYLQSIIEELHKKKSLVIARKNEYYAAQKKLMETQFQEFSADSANNLTIQKIQSLYAQETNLNSQKRIFDEKVPKTFNEIILNIQDIIERPSALTEIEETQDLINELIAIHDSFNSACDGLKPTAQRNRSSSTYKINKFIIEDEVWSNYYNNIERMIEKIKNSEKKTVK